MARSNSYRFAHFVLLLLIITLVLEQNNAAGQQQDIPPVATTRPVKILIPGLPPSHYQFWLRSHPKALQVFEKICLEAGNLTDIEHFQSLHFNLSLEDVRYLNDFSYGKSTLNTICSKLDKVNRSCWGYENSCDHIYLMPECGEPISDERKRMVAWFNQADFGYILDERRKMAKYCSPIGSSQHSGPSSLECTKNFKTCRGQNLFINFDQLPKTGSLLDNNQRYQVEVGNIGGWNCDLQLKWIEEEGGQEKPLESWYNELKNYGIIPELRENCDITIDKQTFIIKLEPPTNMYHYLSNFINLYASMHLNNKFSEDNQIIIWDNQLPRSKFDRMWSAFTRNPLRSIGEFEGKRVCFKKFIFALLPRVVDGPYFQKKLVSGCSKSGLFDAFSKHTLHRLSVTQDYNQKLHNEIGGNFIRVTIARRSTPFKRVVNEVELVNALIARPKDFFVMLIDYGTLTFQEQLRVTHNTDILVGLHGPSLTNLLFLPDWAALVELYDSGDSSYHNLARMRGINYYTPPSEGNLTTKTPIEDKKAIPDLHLKNLVDNEEFSNYKVNVDEFLSVLGKLAKKVQSDRMHYVHGGRNNSEHQEPVATPISDKIFHKITRLHEELR